MSKQCSNYALKGNKDTGKKKLDKNVKIACKCSYRINQNCSRPSQCIKKPTKIGRSKSLTQIIEQIPQGFNGTCFANPGKGKKCLILKSTNRCRDIIQTLLKRRTKPSFKFITKLDKFFSTNLSSLNQFEQFLNRYADGFSKDWHSTRDPVPQLLPQFLHADRAF